MSVLGGFEKEQIRDLLGKGWLTHDGMWFFNVYQRLGIEQANALNRAAIQSLAPIEMLRAKKMLGFMDSDIETFEELRDFMLGSLEIILPQSVFSRAHFESREINTIHWEWEEGECFAYKGMKQIGILDEYECGVMFRIECWLRALGIQYEIEPKIGKCIMHERGACRGEIKTFFDD
jgi:hypothetical protein